MRKITKEEVVHLPNKKELNLLFQKHRIKGWKTKHLCAMEFAREHHELEMLDYIAAFDKASVEKGMMTMTELAKDFWSKCNGTITKWDAYFWIVELFWNRSTQGFKREERAIQWIKDHYNKDAYWTVKEWDTNYAVDIHVDNEIFIQVKPISYFFWKKNNKHYDDAKHERLLKEQKITAYYLYENNEGEFQWGDKSPLQSVSATR